MENFQYILPEIFISISIMLLLLVGVFKKNSASLIYNLSNISLVILLALIINLSSLDTIYLFNNSYLIDNLSNYMKIILVGSGIFVMLTGSKYIQVINLNKIVTQNNLEVGTLAAKINEKKVYSNQNVVKVITKNKLKKDSFSTAVNFFREKFTENDLSPYHHIGVYCYKVSALEKFVSLGQTKNEIQKKLEQLRLIDNNIDINVCLANSTPIGVDTEEDYLELKKKLEYKP